MFELMFEVADDNEGILCVPTVVKNTGGLFFFL